MARRLVCFAERVNTRGDGWDAARTARSEAVWRRDPLRYILTCSALARGPSRARLDAVLGREPDAIHNPLPASHVSGAWDVGMAREAVEAVRPWLREEAAKWDLRVVLLGRRVAAAFGGRRGEGIPLGWVGKLCGAKALLLPHPSGRSREWDDLERTSGFRMLARNFAAWEGDRP